MSLLIALVIGAAAGMIAGFLKNRSDQGLFKNTVIGILGGILGHLLAPTIGIVETNIVGSLAISVIGSLILLFIFDLFR